MGRATEIMSVLNSEWSDLNENNYTHINVEDLKNFIVENSKVEKLKEYLSELGEKQVKKDITILYSFIDFLHNSKAMKKADIDRVTEILKSDKAYIQTIKKEIQSEVASNEAVLNQEKGK